MGKGRGWRGRTCHERAAVRLLRRQIAGRQTVSADAWESSDEDMANCMRALHAFRVVLHEHWAEGRVSSQLQYRVHTDALSSSEPILSLLIRQHLTFNN